MTDPRTHSSIVEEVRQQLTELGFVVNPDDDLTTAICAFQQQRGLVVDGQNRRHHPPRTLRSQPQTGLPRTELPPRQPHVW